MMRFSFLTLALVGVASVANAQMQPMPGARYDSRYDSRYQAMSDDATYPAAITDEYGMRYNARGDRIDARGHIMPPPVTPPGARALR